MIADGQVGLRQARLRDGLKHHKAQFVDGILLIGGLTADGHILVHRRAGGAERVRLRAELVDGQGLDPQAGQKLERVLPGEPAGADVGNIIGVHILVEAAVAQRVAVGLDLKDELDEPDRLDGLAEGLRRLVGHLCADAAHFQKLCASCAVSFLFSKLPCQRAVSKRKGAHGVDHDQHSLVEHGLVDAVRVSQIECGKTSSGTPFISAKSLFQNSGIVDCQMRIARVELALHAKDAGLHKDADLVRQKRLTSGAKIVVFPERRDVAQLLLGFLRDVEYVAVPLFKQIQLLEHKAHGVFREDRRVHVLGRLIAGKQRFVLNIDRHVLQDLFEHKRPCHDAGLILIFLISLRCQNGALGIDVRLFIQHFFTECLHPRS